MQRAGAHKAWFHLYRLIMLPQPPAELPAADAAGEQEQEQGMQAQQRAVAAEQFMQSAPLGEYASRLGLLWAFRCLFAPFCSVLDSTRHAVCVDALCLQRHKVVSRRC